MTKKYHTFSYYFSLYFSNLNIKYLKLTEMDLTRFAMKLFIFLKHVFTLIDGSEKRTTESVCSPGPKNNRIDVAFFFQRH